MMPEQPPEPTEWPPAPPPTATQRLLDFAAKLWAMLDTRDVDGKPTLTPAPIVIAFVIAIVAAYALGEIGILPGYWTP